MDQFAKHLNTVLFLCLKILKNKIIKMYRPQNNFRTVWIWNYEGDSNSAGHFKFPYITIGTL